MHRAEHRVTALVVAMAVAAALVVLTARTASGAEVLAYGSDGWRYCSVTPGDPLIATFYLPECNDASWTKGEAGFGSAGRCLLQSARHTEWSGRQDLLARRCFTVPAGQDEVVVRVAVGDEATLYVNGAPLAHIVHDGCPFPDDYSFVVPPELLVRDGLNLLAVRAQSHHASAFFDLRIVSGPEPAFIEGEPLIGFSPSPSSVVHVTQ